MNNNVIMDLLHVVYKKYLKLLVDVSILTFNVIDVARKPQPEHCVESPADPLPYDGLSSSHVNTPTTPMISPGGMSLNLLYFPIVVVLVAQFVLIDLFQKSTNSF